MREGELLERRIRISRLYDLYSPLLTERQRQVYELHDLEDFSLSEISEELSISRQGVSDQLQRVRERLEDLEQLLGEDSRLRSIESRMEKILALCAGSDDSEFRRLAREILGLCQRGAAEHV